MNKKHLEIIKMGAIAWNKWRSANPYIAPDLMGANLIGAALGDAKNIPATVAATLTVPADGDIIGYKKLGNGEICKLRIPADSKRSSATTRKCRCEYAIVLDGEGPSRHDPDFIYRTGEKVCCHEWDDDRWNECSGGIHFFITREEAEDY